MSKARNRESRIVRASIIGIVANVLLSSFKAVIGIVSGSIAIVLDAINNLTDTLSAILTIFGMRLASKPADKKHPFGHGRYEYLTTIAVSFVIIAAGVMSFVQSVQKLGRPEPSEYKWFSLVVLSIAIMVKIVLSMYYHRIGKEVRSETLTATGADAGFDAIITSATLLAAIATMLFGPGVAWLDGALGLLISLVIVKTGIGMALSPLNQLLGVRVDAEKVIEIQKDISAYDAVLGVYDMMLHNYGPENMIGSVSIEVIDTMTAHEIFDLTRKIQKDILKKYGIYFTIGIYAQNSAGTVVSKMYSHIIELLHEEPEVIQVHGLYIDHTDKTISFDTVMDFSVKDMSKARKALALKIEKAYPDYTVDNVVDLDYSTSE